MIPNRVDGLDDRLVHLVRNRIEKELGIPSRLMRGDKDEEEKQQQLSIVNLQDSSLKSS